MPVSDKSEKVFPIMFRAPVSSITSLPNLGTGRLYGISKAAAIKYRIHPEFDFVSQKTAYCDAPNIVDIVTFGEIVALEDKDLRGVRHMGTKTIDLFSRLIGHVGMEIGDPIAKEYVCALRKERNGASGNHGIPSDHPLVLKAVFSYPAIELDWPKGSLVPHHLDRLARKRDESIFPNRFNGTLMFLQVPAFTIGEFAALTFTQLHELGFGISSIHQIIHALKDIGLGLDDPRAQAYVRQMIEFRKQSS